MKGDHVFNTGRVEIGSAWQRPHQLCDCQEASAFHRFDVCRYGGAWWACMALLAIVAAVVIVATA